MKKSKSIKIFQVFEKYSEFYQPYIPPVIEVLNKEEDIDLTVLIYDGEGEMDFVQLLPNYRSRKIYSKLYPLLNNKYKGLDYLEIKALREKVDVIHIQHSYLFRKVINLLDLPKQERPKIVITLRGGDTYIKPWSMVGWRDFYREYGNKVDSFIVMSEDQKDYLHSKWGVGADKIRVIPVSFGSDGLTESKSPNSDKIRIISAFRMCWEKNIDGNLRVIKSLKEKNVPVEYDIYGDGPDAGQVYFLIDKYDLADCVAYHGKLENKELKMMLPKFDFFLQLSHSESLGLSVVEAQSMGVPVIVANSNGLPESIVDGRTGFSVNSDDVEGAANAILQLWKNPEKYKSFSKEAIGFANSKFTISKEVDKLKKLYMDLIKT